MQVYKVVLVVLTQVLLVECNWFTIRRDKVSDCDYRGYIPGGKVKDVGKLKFPVATMAKSGIESVLGPISQASSLYDSLNTIKAIAGAFEMIAPTLGPVMGVFGAVTGIFKTLTEPSPQDILNACNNAMGTLTKDMNDKIERMEGYVDSQIITVEKNLIQREYQTFFNLWTACVDEVTTELSNECQRDAYALFSAERPKFAVFASKLSSKRSLSGFEARELEAYLVPFRDYANLLLMMLKPLVQTYAKVNSEVGRRHYQRYTKAMKEQAHFFEKYATLAVNAILRVHSGSGGAGVCPRTLDCGPIQIDTEGVWNVNTVNEAVCSCVIEDGTKQLCQTIVIIRKDGQEPINYNKYNYPNCHSDAAGAKEYAGRLLVPEARKYQQKNLKIAQMYWQKELLEFVPVWRKASEIVTPAVRRDETPDEFADEFATQFSERHAVRLEKAERKARQMFRE